MRVSPLTIGLISRVTRIGSAIYVFGILSHDVRDPVSDADISFFIEDELVGSFVFTPTGEDAYYYDVILYANDSLAHTDHILLLRNGCFGGNISLILLDYVVYSTMCVNSSRS